ncbi:MAG: HypC/HybG/HupF family hydrogenase formation chaperone [Candidatus Omnitrophica bacterium]|nr:HypC/HybG/HupF family hydrogenase formation chaperone [Candidatus Omnitrophota bacterium]
MCLATPAKIVKIDKDSAVVDFGGAERIISLGVLSGVKVGDHVLVHAGYAIGKISKSEVTESMKALEELRIVMSRQRGENR